MMEISGNSRAGAEDEQAVIDNIAILTSLSVIVYVCVRAVVLDRSLPWFGKKKVFKPTGWR